MDFEFDKEIDFLIRDHAKRERAAQNSFAENAPESSAERSTAYSAHLDADDLAAFAENAVPQNLRAQFAAHLADCGNCRQTLSGLMLINEAAEEAETQTIETAKTREPARASWLESLRRLFAFPTLTYATAGLAVLLVGTIAFVALQNQNENFKTNVALNQPNEQTAPQAAQPVTPPAATTSVAKPEQAPENAPQPSPTIENKAAETPAENQTATSSDSASDNLPPSVVATRNPGNSGNSAAAANTTARGNQTASATNSTASANANASTASRARASNQNAAPTEERQRPGAQQPNRESQARRPEPQESDSSGGIEGIFVPRAGAAPLPPSEKRTIANKTFQKNFDKVWEDSTYKSQPARLVLRNSREYKKLDAGLRQIADKLSGEVIVVWQGKAYKIR